MKSAREETASSAAPPAAQHLVQIEKPVYGGAFLARLEGKAVFVPLVLPGEPVRLRIVRSKSGHATAEAEEIVRAAPERIAPACPHFGLCGGCHYQHTGYATQLGFKEAILRETLERGGVCAPAEIGILAGQPETQAWGYRNRVRLAFDADGNPGYRSRRSHTVVPLRACPIAAPLLVETAQAFAELARGFAAGIGPRELTLFCNSTETALLVAVSTANPPTSQFDEMAKALLQRIPALRGLELAAEGNRDEQPQTLARWGAGSLDYRAASFDYRVDQGAFFQVNRWLVDALVNRVVAGQGGALAWDLFAGVGLFARQLTTSFERVVAVESASAARAALEANLRGTAGEAVAAETLAFLRGSRRLNSGGFARPDFVVPDLIVLDPPRSGLGAESCARLAEIAAPNAVYVSCDPATLARDLRALTSSVYRIDSITLADLFPQTYHLETVVQLRRC
ncbi:MAG: 23S rRNA (uracil(1939)-C(5))-methyltransferase RlmD [Terracidiphilus sp.]